MVALLILAFAVIVVFWIICTIKIKRVAEDKGYEGGFVVLLCIFCSPLLGVIFVAAMPDKYSQESLERIRTMINNVEIKLLTPEETSRGFVDIRNNENENKVSAGEKLKDIPTLFHD